MRDVPRPCARVGCPQLAVTGGSLCGAHQYQANADRMADPNRIYSQTRWRKLRAYHLGKEPNCRVCGAPATDVDHRLPISQGGDPWDPRNLQSLCHSHHSTKTGLESAQRRPV